MLGLVQRTAQAGGGLGAARRRLAEVAEHGAVFVVQHLIAQADAVRFQHRAQRLGAVAQILQGVAVAELTDPAAVVEAEGIGEEHLAVVGIRLEDQLVDPRILLRVFRQTDLHARLQQGAEGLRHHRRQAALPDPVRVDIAAPPGVAVDAGRVERHQRVDADQQIDAAFQQHRGVHGPAQRAVDVVAAAHFHRRIQARQRGAGLHGLGNRDVFPFAGAETHGFAAVQVHCDHVQLAIELAEIVATAAAREDLPQETLDFGIVEQAGRHQPAETLHQVG